MSPHVVVARDHVLASVVVGLVVIVVSFASGLGIVYRTPAGQLVTQPSDPSQADPSLASSAPTHSPVTYTGVASPPDATLPSATPDAPSQQVVRVRAVRRTARAVGSHPAAVPTATTSRAPEPCPTHTTSLIDTVLGTQLLEASLLDLSSQVLQINPLLTSLLGSTETAATTPVVEPTPGATTGSAAETASAAHSASNACAGPVS